MVVEFWMQPNLYRSAVVRLQADSIHIHTPLPFISLLLLVGSKADTHLWQKLKSLILEGNS